MSFENNRKHQKLEMSPPIPAKRSIQHRAIKNAPETNRKRGIWDTQVEDGKISKFYNFLKTPILSANPPAIQRKDKNHSADPTIQMGHAYLRSGVDGNEIIQKMENFSDEEEVTEDPETNFGKYAYAVLKQKAKEADLVIGGDSDGKMMYVWTKDRENEVGEQHCKGNEHIHLIQHKMSVHLVYTYKPENAKGPNFGNRPRGYEL
jgi:hypothetical protein